uniref:C2 domain-containing protein n=1 Tax=Anopheles farauti TaxID=69004 RepID=A0A182QS67_9DIPT
MASGRARLPPTPGTVASVSMVPCTRPLTELHSNNNLYHSSAATISGSVQGDGTVPSLDYQHTMHHPQASQSAQLGLGGAGLAAPASHHHHLLHHQQEVGLATSVASTQLLPDTAPGHGVTQSLRKPFDAPRHIPERPSQLADESDWMSDYADSNQKRRNSISKDYLPATTAAATTTADWLKKSIRRSWTISNAEDDNGATRDPDVQPYPNPHLPRKQSQSSYPSLVKHPYFSPLSMADEDEYGEEEDGELQEVHQRPAALRRAMPPRQSTLPNPEGIYYGSNNNLMPTVSPKQQLSPSPQYNTSPYHTDNEADNETGSDHRSPLSARYKIRRQSTLPCKPNEMQLESGGTVISGGGMMHGGSGPKIMMSSSPNSRTNLYSKSPERDGIDAAACKQQQRFPPFPLQQQQQQHTSQQAVSVAPPIVGQQRQLPTSPNRLVFNKSPDSGTESGPGASESSGTSPHQISTATGSSSRTGARSNYQMTRQATLPNPEQHMKLLPTSPPKKQLSPHSIKRSPDFARQNTLPASPQQQQPQQTQQSVTGPQSTPLNMPMPLAASSCSSLTVGTMDGTAMTASAVTMNSLSVHQHGPKFMPISPRQKASFLFPQPSAPTSRPFHSQQHFPTHLNTSPSASTVSGGVGVTGTGSVTTGIGASHSSSSSLSSAAVVASKMIKVRSHSNEEYTLAPATRAIGITAGMGTVSEGRRMLPEIPTGGGTGPGGSRSPRLVRQEHVRDELLAGCVNSVAGQGPNPDKRTTTSSSSSPKQKTFAEAKQTMAAAAAMMAEDTMMAYEPYGGNASYDGYYDEDQELALDAVDEGGGGIGGYQDNDNGGASEPFSLLPVQQQQQQQQRQPFVPNDSSPESIGSGSPGVGYGFAHRKDRLRSRRKSRDMYDHPDEVGGACAIKSSDDGGSGVRCTAVATGEPVKRKPETMRSISEEAPAAKPPKPITRRSLSHPEKDTQLYGSKKLESSKIPSPKPLTELQDRQYKPSAGIGMETASRRKNIKSFDCGTISSKASSNLQPTYQQQQYHQQLATEGGGAPSSVSPGVATESTRTSGYGGSATTLGGNASSTSGTTATAGATIGGFQSFGQRKISAFQQILQRQRLQKRDSKSLDIVASKLMEEKYGGRGQDVDVSKSLDDGIFSESAGNQSDDNSSDEHINLAYKSSDNKTTLGEAEIQNAVEAAAVIFKKVVLQRREENKCKSSNANLECHSCADGLTDDSTTLGGYSSSETDTVGRIQSLGRHQHQRNGPLMPTDYEEYRLVFFSSDSSSKEEEYDSSSTSSSTAMRHVKRQRYTTATSLEECDWDYFEPDMMPGADEAKSAHFYEMLAMATGTAAKAAVSATSARNASRKLNNTYCHCDCGYRRQMQYVPIPVPVPVPVPISAFQSWLYEQQQQLLLMHGTPESADAAASEFALRSDLVQQLWKKFAECGSETGVRSEPPEMKGDEKRKEEEPGKSSFISKCACKLGGTRRYLECCAATSESHDSSDNERNAAKVRTCKHIGVRRDKSGATAVTVNSDRNFVVGGGGGGEGDSSSGSEAAKAAAAAAASVVPSVDGKVQMQKTTTPTPTWSKKVASMYGAIRRDGSVVVDGVDSVSDSFRRSLASSGVGDGSASSIATAKTTAALQLLQRAVIPPLRSGEFSSAVPVTTSAANDIVTTTAEPIQARDNIVTVGEATNGRVQIREITTGSNVRAGVAAASSSSSLVVTASVTDEDDDDNGGAGLKTAMDDQTEPTELARREEIVLRLQPNQPDGGNVDGDNSSTRDNTSHEENRNLNQPRSEVPRESSKNRPESATGERDGYLQYELFYHLAQTGGRSSPSSSSGSSSEAESTGHRAGRKVKAGKYYFNRAGSSGEVIHRACSSSSSSSCTNEKCSTSPDSDSEGDAFVHDRALDDGVEQPQDEDDGCCFDGDDDDDDERHLPRFSAVMVVNAGHGSDSVGQSDSSDSSDNQQSFKAGGAHRYYSEVAGGDYDDESDDGDGSSVVVLKRVKIIACSEGVRECASERTRWDDDELFGQNCAEVSIELQRESIVGSSNTQQRPAHPVVDEWGERGRLDPQCNVEHATLQGGSRKSGETDGSNPPPDRCCADVGESIAHQQQKVEEKGTVSDGAPDAHSYVPDADWFQQKLQPLQQQQHDASIKAEEKPQHHDQHDATSISEEIPLTGNSASSSATGVYRKPTPSPPHTAHGLSETTCVSSALRECIGSATTTTNTTTSTTTIATARGDIKSTQTPHTVSAVTNTSPTVLATSRNSSNKSPNLVMIATDTSDPSIKHEQKIVNKQPYGCGEGILVCEKQVTIPAGHSPTSKAATETETVPSSAVPDQSDEHDEIKLNADTQQQLPVVQSTVCNDYNAEAEQSLCASVPERLPEQRQTADGGAFDGPSSLHHHVHHELTHDVPPQSSGEMVVSGIALHDDQKSSTEVCEKNPTTSVMDQHNRQSPSPSTVPASDAGVETVVIMDEENRGRRENVLLVSSDRDDFCVPQSQCAVDAYTAVENRRQLCDYASEAEGESLMQPVSMEPVAYGNEAVEQYDNGDVMVQTQNNSTVAMANVENEGVAGIGGQGSAGALSAVICLEDGLADDDSWVEEISQDEEEFATTTATDSDLDDSSEEMSFANDREEELRGYNRTAIDFTLHTIVEESCEDSEAESRGSDAEGRTRARARSGRRCSGEGGMDEDYDCSRDPAHRLSASELEKYFFYGLGGDDRAATNTGGGSSVVAMGGSGATYLGGAGGGVHDDHSEMSEESSSLCSDGGHDSLGSGTASGSLSAVRLSGASMESHDQDLEPNFNDSVADLASSRLEKYFLTGFLGYSSSDRGGMGGNAGGGGGGGGGNVSDGSGGSVGSDSEGHASPEQRRKRLVRARGATRSHSSLDNLLMAGKDAEHSHDSNGSNVPTSTTAPFDVTAGAGTGSSPSGILGGGVDIDHSSETDTCDESSLPHPPHQDRMESSSYDTIGKRKKKYMLKKMDAALSRSIEQQHSTAPPVEVGPLTASVSEMEDGRRVPPQQSISLDTIVCEREPTSAKPNATSTINSPLHPAGVEYSRKHTSRDSGFIGSNDDLLKEDQLAAAATACSSKSTVPARTTEPSLEAKKNENKQRDASTSDVHRVAPGYLNSPTPASPGSSKKQSTSDANMVNLVRKDSFNNWSSDEETNLMMSKMRQFFKSLVAASANTRKMPSSSCSTPAVSGTNTPQQGGSTPVARPRGMRTKPPQLVYFESELTRLMKTVPGIRDEQVREIVEYLSSEDTWSDSYDSSDYTSSDLEGATAAIADGSPFYLQEEISASCRQIINKFDNSARKDEEGDIGDGGLVTVGMATKKDSSLIAHQRHHLHQQQHPSYRQNTPLSKETAFVYQRLVASLSKAVSNETPSRLGEDSTPLDVKPNAAGIPVVPGVSSTSSPPLIAKVMHHIGSRLVALMHEVSNGESPHTSVTPKHHRMGSHRKSGRGVVPISALGGPGLGIGPGGIGGDRRGEEEEKRGGEEDDTRGGGEEEGKEEGEGGGLCSSIGGHHHHHYHHQAISVTTTEDDEDSSTSESNDRMHHNHPHHHRPRMGPGPAAMGMGTPIAVTSGQEEQDDLGVVEGSEGTVPSASYPMLLPRSKSHDLLLGDQRSQGQYHYGAGGDMVGEERSGEASDYERFSWRGSFESALLANGDSRTKLSMLDNSSSSMSVLVAKRRSAGDLLFNNQNLSQEQLDRVRSCGSIGGDREEFESPNVWEAKQRPPHHYQHSQHYSHGQPHHQHQMQPHHQHYGQSSASSSRRRLSSVAADEEETDSDEGVMKGGNSRLVLASRSTLPRSLQNTMASGTTNSLPRLPTSNLQTILQSAAPSSSASSSSSGTTGSGSAKPLSTAAGTGGMGMGQKSQSVYHFLQNNVKSARYRAPGFNRPPSAPKRAMSAPGLHPSYPRRERRSRLQQLVNEESNSPDLAGSTVGFGGDDDPHGNSPRGAGDLYERSGGDGTAPNGMQNNKGDSMVSSPVGSAGGGSENWPSQSDEDIDRLVALHQNRASLSSLGVRSDSMASVYSGAGEGRYGTVTVRGQIEFGMQYNYKQGALEIHIKQCKDLAAVDTKRNRSDPYVKVYLLPDKSKSGKRKTKVKKHTLNPVFDEVLRFHMSLNSLQTRTIWITVWHSDMFGRNDFLGEVMMGLQDKVFDNPQPQWYQLQERSEPFEDLSAYKGDIIVGLKYVSADVDSGGIIGASSGTIGGGGASSGSTTGGGFGTLNLRKFSTRSLTSNSSSTLSGHSKGALHVLVKEAKHLQPIKSNGTCDAFCKSYLLPDKNRSSKQKTPVIKRTNSPVWNYTFVYEDVSLAELSERALELTIWDHDRLASNEFLGGVRFSLGNGKHNGRAVEWMDSTGKELSLWQNMINRPNFWVEGALVLRPSLENAKFST